MWNGGEYSYDAGCADGDRIDPVTTVIRIWGSTAAEHFAHHTLDVGADTQHYRDGGGCVEGDHLFMGSEYWGNRHEMEQCAGEDVPPDLDDPDTTGSDGWVNYIRG